MASYSYDETGQYLVSAQLDGIQREHGCMLNLNPVAFLARLALPLS
jgi:hypothetical protein